MSTYRIDIGFTSRVKRSPRVLEIAESFGIGLEDKQFTIYDGLEVQIRRGDVVYITGQSGSGKSLLLRELAEQMAKTQKVVSLDEVKLDEVPLIDQIGATTREAVELLSFAGLNDAMLFLRKPSELSDGQRYRFRVAKLIESDAQVWVADEFGAVLDRTTARAVAYKVQQFARKVGATLIVATTHKDLRDELGPTLYIDKRFRDKITVETQWEQSLTSALDSLSERTIPGSALRPTAPSSSKSKRSSPRC